MMRKILFLFLTVNFVILKSNTPQAGESFTSPDDFVQNLYKKVRKDIKQYDAQKKEIEEMCLIENDEIKIFKQCSLWLSNRIKISERIQTRLCNMWFIFEMMSNEPDHHEKIKPIKEVFQDVTQEKEFCVKELKGLLKKRAKSIFLKDTFSSKMPSFEDTKRYEDQFIIDRNKFKNYDFGFLPKNQSITLLKS